MLMHPDAPGRDAAETVEIAGVAPWEWARDSPRPTTRSRTTLDVPAGVSTLASAVPGQAVEVRTILDGAGESVATLRPRDLLTCRARTADWLVFEQNGRTEVAVHRCDAGRVCIERETPYVVDAAHGAASR